MNNERRIRRFAVVSMTIVGTAITSLLCVSDANAQMFNYPPIYVDPVVNVADGMVTFPAEWNSACWIPDFNGIGTLYAEYKYDWMATSSGGNQTMYPGATMFLLHDLSGLVTQDDQDYNSFKVIVNGVQVTGFVFGNDNHPDDLDYEWIGGTGLGYNEVDDRGFIARFNNDILTDVHWYPSYAEPGDPGFDWDDWYGFFGTYGFNNTAYTCGLPNSINGNNEIYEVAFRNFSELDTSGGGGGSGTVNGFVYCEAMTVKICDPHEPYHMNFIRVELDGHIYYSDNRDMFFVIPKETAKNVSYGNTATLDFSIINWTGQTQTFDVFAAENQGFGVQPSITTLTLANQQDTTLTFSVPIPASSTMIGIRDTVVVSTPNYSNCAWFEVADVLFRLDISPDTAYLDVGETLDLGLYGFDFGNRILAVNPTWSVVGGIGSITPGTPDHIPEEMRTATFTAENSGEGYVKAQVGAVSDSVYVFVSGGGPNVWISLTNTGPDTFYSSAGGTLTYNIAAGNNEPNPQIVDVWVDLTLPSGEIYGPIVGPVQDFTMAAGWSTNRDRQLNIPAGLPSTYEGTFTTNGYIGEYDPPNSIIYAEDHFDWEYVVDTWAGDITEVGYVEFVDTGERFESAQSIAEAMPAVYSFSRVYPNPFNPMTTLNFNLPDASHVKLEIYNLQGCLVAAIIDGWRDVGLHEVTFDGSSLASGIYMARLEVGDISQTQKMVLMK